MSNLLPALGSHPTFGHLAPAFGQGYLRQPGDKSTINAHDDIEAVSLWLAEIEMGVEMGTRSRHTLLSARREAERLILWASITLGKAIGDLRRRDAIAYHRFLLDPKPRSIWCGKRVARTHPEWRPFQGPLKATSANQAITIISGLYNYLCTHGYYSANPFAGLKQHDNRRRGPRVQAPTAKGNGEPESEITDRMIDAQMWAAIIATIDRWPRDTEARSFHYERTRFVLSFMYLLAPRLSDMATHTMSDLQLRRDSEGNEGWWWNALGKGNKAVLLPMPEDAVNAVRRWRRSIGLPGMPDNHDNRPLVSRRNNPDRAVGPVSIYKLVKDVVTEAATRFAVDDPRREAIMRKVSPHWFRHTALTQLAEILPIKIVSELARHSDIRTTSGYIHTPDASLYAAAQRHRLPWPAA